MAQNPNIMSTDRQSSVFAPDDALILEDDLNEVRNQPHPQTNSWKIIIVDDEPEVHTVTKLALRRFTFDGKPLAFISSQSGEDAKQLIEKNPDAAIILLDIVMETSHSGLMVVKHIREVLENHLVRIVLRTGQPGQAPEEDVILNYDINDYKTKTELTREKLFSTMVTALRSYRDVSTIEMNRKELQALNRRLEQRQIELELTNHKLRQEIIKRKKLEAERIEQERLRLENEFLERQSKELAKLNADKDTFFSIVSHDLRSPFNVVLGSTKLMLNEFGNLTGDDLQMLIQGVYNSAQITYNLLENLLDWARMQMDGIEYQPGQVDLRKLIENTTRLLGEVATRKNVHLKNRVKSATLVVADDNMLETVIRNLVSNALKFTPPDGTVTLSAQPVQPVIKAHGGQPKTANPKIEVSVSDTGVGINPNDLQKLFSLGTHHTTYGTAQEKGSGLGLLICKEMIEKHGGQIWVESEVGAGTTVKFTLMAVQPEPAG